VEGFPLPDMTDYPTNGSVGSSSSSTHGYGGHPRPPYAVADVRESRLFNVVMRCKMLACAALAFRPGWGALLIETSGCQPYGYVALIPPCVMWVACGVEVAMEHRRGCANHDEVVRGWFVFSFLVDVYGLVLFGPDSPARVAAIAVELCMFLTAMSLHRTALWPWEQPPIIRPHSHRPAPRHWANFWSKWTFLWAWPLLKRGIGVTGVAMPDLPDSPDKWKLESMCQRFEAEWDREFHSNGADASLFRVMLKVYGRWFFLQVIPCLVSEACSLLSPVVLQFVLDDIQNGIVERTIIFQYTSAFFAIAICQALFVHNMWMNNVRVALALRYALVMIINKKATKLSQRAKLEMTLGRIQNIISEDCNSIVNALPCFHWWTWGLLVKFIVPTCFLWGMLREAFIVGLGAVCVGVPISTRIAKKIKQKRKDLLKIRDRRVKLTGEVFRSIATVKCLGWDDVASAWVNKERDAELKATFHMVLLDTANGFVIFGMGAAAPIITFAYYVLVMRNTLTLSVAFTSFTWLTMLRNALNGFPNIYQQFIMVYVSFERVRDFLLAGERPAQPSVSPDSVVEYAAVFSNATLCCYDEEALDTPSSLSEDNNVNSMVKLCEDTVKSAVACCSQSDRAKLRAARADVLAEKLLQAQSDGTVDGLIVVRGRQHQRAWWIPRCLTDPFSDEQDRLLSRKDILTNLNLKIPRGKFTVIVGAVGEGKSILVRALTGGDVEIVAGEAAVDRRGGIAYAAQDTWLQSGTIRENILLGREFSRTIYDAVISACELDADLAELSKGDETKIGENGVKLSGGQKARLGMARAAYVTTAFSQEPGMFVFDDTLAALDAQVSRKVFTAVLVKLLAGRTRVLVTHDPRWMQDIAADRIVQLAAGRVEFDGVRSSIGESSSELLQTMNNAQKPGGSNSAVVSQPPSDVENVVGCAAQASLVAQATLGSATLVASKAKPPSKGGDADEDEEAKKIGSVGIKVYSEYFLRAMNCAGVGVWFVLTFLQVFLNIVYSGWLAIWIAGEDDSPLGIDVGVHSDAFFLAIYGALTALLVFSDSARRLLYRAIGFKCGRVLHREMLSSVLKSHMSFFWNTPSGRVVNRFAGDMGSIDDSVAMCVGWFVWCFITFSQSMIVCTATTPKFLIVAVPVMAIYWIIGIYYRYAERDCKRLVQIAQSPLFVHFSEVLQGVGTITSFGAEEFFEKSCRRHVLQRNCAYYYLTVVQQFAAMYMDFLGSLLIIAGVFFALDELRDGRVSKPMACLAVTFSLQIQGQRVPTPMLHVLTRSAVHLKAFSCGSSDLSTQWRSRWYQWNA
jgi:ABC-type multidrug transport system fused ATPase/permease subunit